MKPLYYAGLAGVGLAALIAACAPQTQASSAAEDYVTLCADCHGPGGKGDGPLAEGMTPRPVDITRIARDNGGVLPKAREMSHIYGFTPGRSESPMPQFADLMDGRTVMFDSGDGIPTPTPARLVALLEYVEGLQE